MVTVLAVYNSAGCVGRCDALCHNAAKSECDCICGGRNHGIGTKRAIANVEKAFGVTAEAIEHFAAVRGLKPQTLTVYDALKIPTPRIRRLRAKEKKREAWRKLLEAP